MKNRMAVLLALIIGFSYCPSVLAETAAEDAGKTVESKETAANPGEADDSKEKSIENGQSKEKDEKNKSEKEKTADAENEKNNKEVSSQAEENLEKTEENGERFVDNKEYQEKDGKSEENKKNRDVPESEDSFLHNLLGNLFSKGEKKEQADDSSSNKQKSMGKKSAEQESAGLKNLQIPQKLDVVIDPWEVDKKGQVYSEQYMIGNTGETAGVLTLSGLTCRPREQSGVVVRTQKEGLHDSGDKSIYMEMLLGNGEEIVFSQENSLYQTKLEPGEELSICFAGEVNENAFGEWKNDDISVSMVYSWETEDDVKAIAEPDEKSQFDDEKVGEERSDADIEDPEESKDADSKEKPKADSDSKEELKSDSKAETSKNNSYSKESEKEENPVSDPENEKQENQNVNEAESEKEPSAVADASTNINTDQEIPADSTPGEMKNSGNPVADGDGSTENVPDSAGESSAEVPDSGNNQDPDGQEKGELKNIDLQETQKVDVAIESWKTDEKGRIVSPQYLLQNIGDAAGIWELSELVCKPQEQAAVTVITDKNILHDSAEKAVYMELVLGNGEKVILSQEHSQYRVELKPGEQLLIRFVGEMNGNLFEMREDGDIAVTAVCTWSLE